jgi:TP901 family phage tail tape measure protein
MQAKALGFTQGFSKNLKVMDGQLSKVASSLTRVGTAVGAAGAATAAAFGWASKSGMDFEHTMASLNAVAKPTADELAQISETAKVVGRDFGFSAVDVAAGMEAMSKQGLSVQEVLAGISGVAASASADGSTLTDTMGGMLATMAGMGLKAKDLGLIGDVMAKAGDSTAASIGSLSESMAVFGPTARALGIPLKSAIGQLAILQDAGIDASSAGTTLSAVYSKLASPVDGTAKALKSLGITIADTYGNLKPPDQLMAEIFEATNAIEGNVGKAAAITELVGLNSQKALLNIAASVGSGKYATVMNGLKDGVDGYAASIAKLKQDSTTGKIAKMTASFEALRISIFGLVSKDLQGLIEKVTSWASANEGLITSGIQGFIADFKEALPTIVTWLERIGKTLVVFYTFAAAVKGVNMAMTVFNALMAVNPFVLLTYAIVGAVALIWAFWPEISDFFSKLWKGIVDIASKVATAIGTFFSGLFAKAKPYIQGFYDFVVGLMTIISFPFRWAFEKAVGYATEALNYIKGLWAPIGEWFSGVWTTASEGAASAWSSVKAGVKSVYDEVVKIWQPIGGFFSGLWDGIAGAFKTALGWVIEKLGWIADKASWIFEKAAELGGDVQEVGQNTQANGLNSDLGANVISPQERVSKQITEQRSSHELNINAPPGVATLGKSKGSGLTLNLQPTGTY